MSSTQGLILLHAPVAPTPAQVAPDVTIDVAPDDADLPCIIIFSIR